jgi:hypothetical protein
MQPSSRLLKLLPILVAVAGTLIFHRYTVLSGLDAVQADSGDSRFIAFLLEHWNNALHLRADWRSPPIFWPVRGTLAYSDLLVGMAVPHAVLRAVLDVFVAINVQLILLTLATFASSYALFRRGFALEVAGAALGAAFVAFSWPRFAQLVHLQLQFMPPLPLLALLALECLRDGALLSRRGFAVRASAFVALLALLLATTLYDAIFAALAVTIATVLCGMTRAGRRHLVAIARRQAAGLLAAAVVALLLLGPVVAFYVPLMRESRGRLWSEVVPNLPRPTELLWMGKQNMVWGWFFNRWPDPVVTARWPELRIGVGVVGTLAWAATGLWAAVSLIARRHGLDRSAIALCVAILTGLALQALMLRWPGDHSAWWLVWKGFPGARGIRAVTRLQLLVTLPMGLAFGAALDRALRARREWAWAAIALVAFGAAEQVGRSSTYSGARAIAVSRLVADAIPRTCAAAYVIATPDRVTNPPVVDEAHFDAGSYLLANPDVAAAWDRSPWEHYVLFGRAERRFLDPSQGVLAAHLLFFYNYTIPLAATLARIPVVNGLSGWQPGGWNLFDVLAPDAQERLPGWLLRQGVAPNLVCVIRVRLQLDMVPDREANLL